MEQTGLSDADFMRRRDAARARLDQLTGARGGDRTNRTDWFKAVYDNAGGDGAAVPWADLAPKAALTEWLTDNPGGGRTAIDVACGLGDNAEALAAAGYHVTAFDLSDTATSWAGRRFPLTSVAYQAADLFDLPEAWLNCFDLVLECYTIQALNGDLRDKAFAAIAAPVALGGRLVVIARIQPDDTVAGTGSGGPPWPLSQSELARFFALGFVAESRYDYAIRKDVRSIPHTRMVFQRPG